MMSARVQINLHDLIAEHEISMRKLGRLTDIRPATLNDLANQKRENINFNHISKIASALEVTDIRKIIDFGGNDYEE